jgi:hypothetical protein
MKKQGRGRKKERFIRRFRKRFLLRFHMSLILAATCLSGALFSKFLLFLSVSDPLIRYPLTATLSYAQVLGVPLIGRFSEQKTNH